MLKQEEFLSKRDQIIHVTNALKYHYNHGDFLDLDKNFNQLLEKITGVFEKDDIITDFIANEELHHKYKQKYEEAVEYIKLLELNKLDKKLSFDKFSNQNNHQADNNGLDESVNSASSFEKLIENGDHYYISDTSELGFKHRIKKNSNVSITTKQNQNNAEEDNQTSEIKNVSCIFGMEPEKLRDEYIRIFEEKKKIEHDYLILLDKVPMLEFSEKNYQEALAQIETLNEKNKQITNEISNLKCRLTKLGEENTELMDLNHQYCEAISGFETESGNAKSKNIIECTKIKKLEQELSNAHKKFSDLETQIEKINFKRIKELEERTYIENRYEDIIHEQENALANIVLDQEKIYRDSLIEKLFDENNNELSNKLNFTYNQATDKIEIFFDDEKLFEIENFDNKKTLKKFKSMNLMKTRDINEIPEKTKNRMISDLSFSYFESEDSNDDKNNKKSFLKETYNASTKEPSRPSDPNSNNIPKMLIKDTDIPFKDIKAGNSYFKKKNFSCQFNQRVKDFLKKMTPTSNDNCNVFGSFTPSSINDFSCIPNTLKSFIENKSASFKNPNHMINFSKNKDNFESNIVEFTCGKRTKRKSMSSSSLNKIINGNYSQIKNDNSKSLSSFNNKERELKKFYTPLNLKNKEQERIQKSIENVNKSNNPGVGQFSLKNSINEKLVNLSNKSSNFKSKLSFALISRNKTEKLLSTFKNKLFNSENNQNFILENLHMDQTLENETITDKMRQLENNYIDYDVNENQNIDNPLFKSTNSSFLNDTSFNSKVIRRTTLDNFNIISCKLTSFTNRNFDEIKKKNLNNNSLNKMNNEVLEANSNNDSHSDSDSFKKNIKSNCFTLAEKKFILEDLVEEEKNVKDFEINNSGVEEKHNKKLESVNTSQISNNANTYYDHKEDLQNDKAKHFFVDDIELFEIERPLERHFTFSSAKKNKKDCMEIENSVNIIIECKSKFKESEDNNTRNQNCDKMLSNKHLDVYKDQRNNKRIHRKSLSNVELNKVDFDNFKAKIYYKISENEEKIKNNKIYDKNINDPNSNSNESINRVVKESIFEKIRKDLILSSKKSGNTNQFNKTNNKNLDEKSDLCKHKGVCHKHLKINKALIKNRSKQNFDSIYLNTDYTKKTNFNIGFNPIKSFMEEEDNLSCKQNEKEIENRINKLNLKSIKAKFDKDNLVDRIIRKSIANTTLKNEFLNELKLNNQNNLLNEEELNQKRLSTNITTNNHYWKYTINLIPSQESSFNNKPNSHRNYNNNNPNKIMNNHIKKHKFRKSSGESDHLNISIISDCNPAILDENNNENVNTNGTGDNRIDLKNSSNDLNSKNDNHPQKGFNEITIETQINNFCIVANEEVNLSFNNENQFNNKTNFDNNECQKEKYSDFKLKKEISIQKKKRNENKPNDSICNKSKLSDQKNDQSYISLRKKNSRTINSPYKEKEILSGDEDENDQYGYSNSYKSRENLLNNAYAREKYISSSLCQKNNNLNFKINLDFKIQGTEGELKLINNLQNKNDVYVYGIDFVSEMIIQNRLNTLLSFYKKRYNLSKRPFRKQFYLAEGSYKTNEVLLQIEDKDNSQIASRNESDCANENKYALEQSNLQETTNSDQNQDKEGHICNIF